MFIKEMEWVVKYMFCIIFHKIHRATGHGQQLVEGFL